MHGIPVPGGGLGGSDALEQSGERRIGGGQMLGQAQEMQVHPVVQEGAAGGDADGSAEIAHQIEQPRGQLQAIRCKPAQSEGNRRRHGELLGKAAQRLGQQQLGAAPVMGDGREVPHAGREAGEAEHHQPAQVDALGKIGV
ncbi:MAG TPA: hypothetical protein VGH25_08840, partial [Dongiaceae bacterium]